MGGPGLAARQGSGSVCSTATTTTWRCRLLEGFPERGYAGIQLLLNKKRIIDLHGSLG
jgi:hypothetical protein